MAIRVESHLDVERGSAWIVGRKGAQGLWCEHRCEQYGGSSGLLVRRSSGLVVRLRVPGLERSGARTEGTRHRSDAAIMYDWPVIQPGVAITKKTSRSACRSKT